MVLLTSKGPFYVDSCCQKACRMIRFESRGQLPLGALVTWETAGGAGWVVGTRLVLQAVAKQAATLKPDLRHPFNPIWPKKYNPILSSFETKHVKSTKDTLI